MQVRGWLRAHVEVYIYSCAYVCVYVFVYVYMQVMNMATALQGLYLADQQEFANAGSWMIASTCGRVYIFMCV